MSFSRRSLLAASVGATMMPALPRLSHAQAANTIRIGVLNDQSGTYRDISGPYGVECTKQAVQ
jgi:branched-chain amino acid transport system substrate-binding protein